MHVGGGVGGDEVDPAGAGSDDGERADAEARAGVLGAEEKAEDATRGLGREGRTRGWSPSRSWGATGRHPEARSTSASARSESGGSAPTRRIASACASEEAEARQRRGARATAAPARDAERETNIVADHPRRWSDETTGADDHLCDDDQSFIAPIFASVVEPRPTTTDATTYRRRAAMASSSSSSSGGDDDRRRRRAERRFLRACRKGSLRKAKRRLRRCPTLDLECRVPRGVRSGADAGRTPLHLACAAGAEDLLRWLVKLGADVTPPDDAGDTPAHLLARHAASRPTALDALRRAGADVHRVRDARGETPSDIAARVVERQTRRLLEAEERRAARRDADRRADGASEGLGGVAAARDADAAWREKILDEAAFAEGEGADWGAERARASHASFFASFADDDDPEPYRWREEEGVSSSGRETSSRVRRRRRRAGARREGRDAAAQRILDEARRQDATWRAEVAARSKPSSASTRPSPETYRARWGRGGGQGGPGGDARARRRALARARGCDDR